jgi:hypothetical protein
MLISFCTGCAHEPLDALYRSAKTTRSPLTAVADQILA